MSYPSLSTLQYIASLQTIRIHLYQYGGPILLTLGTIGSTLNLIVFLQKNLRKNPCTIFLVAFNVSNLSIFYLAFLFDMLQFGYQINLTARNLAFCRFYFYCLFLCGCLGPSFLLLAAIDRTLITSRNARTRQWSTRQKTYISIAIVTLFWLIFHIHAFIYPGIIEPVPNYLLCQFPTVAYATFVTYFTVVVQILLYLALGICGVLTVKNMRRPHAVGDNSTTLNDREAFPTNSRSVNPKEQQLILICLTEILIFFIFASPQALHLIYLQSTLHQKKTPEQSAADSLTSSFLNFAVYIPYSVSLYTNTLISKNFRAEIKNLFKRSQALCCGTRTRVEAITR